MADKKPINHDQLVVENLMRTENGRKYVYDYLEQCRTFSDIFDSDPIQHAHNAGLRKAGLILNSDLREYAPAFYTKMLEENS